MDKNEIKIGAILSYLLIVLNAVFGLVIAPYMLSTIGESEYGVYKTIGSLAISIAVLEFGIGGTLQRYIAKYRAQNDYTKVYNFSAMSMIETLILSVIMLIVGFVLYFTIEPIYKTSFTESELYRGKQIFIVLLFYVVLHFFENVFNGIATGYNKFIFINSMKVLSLLIKTVLYFVLLPIYRNSFTIVIISVVQEIVVLFIEVLYIRIKLKHKSHLYYWDKSVFKESFIYTVFLFVQTLIIQFNGNIDNMVIGAVIGTLSVTIYSFAIQIFNMFEQCATSISGVVLPTIMNMENKGMKSEDYEKVVVRFGRIQWVFLGAALFGFISCGYEFFSIWLGHGYEDCYLLSLILMIPTVFPLIVNICLAILKAKNLLKFRTVALISATVLNACLTIIGTHFWGYWAAAVGTAVSKIVGSILMMNWYYSKVLKINMIRVYIKIFRKTTICLLVPCLVSFVLSKVIYGSFWSFVLKVIVFLMLYFILLILYGLDTSEKKEIPFVRRFL